MEVLQAGKRIQGDLDKIRAENQNPSYYLSSPPPNPHKRH